MKIYYQIWYRNYISSTCKLDGFVTLNVILEESQVFGRTTY